MDRFSPASAVPPTPPLRRRRHLARNQLNPGNRNKPPPARLLLPTYADLELVGTGGAADSTSPASWTRSPPTSSATASRTTRSSRARSRPPSKLNHQRTISSYCFSGRARGGGGSVQLVLEETKAWPLSLVGKSFSHHIFASHSCRPLPRDIIGAARQSAYTAKSNARRRGICHEESGIERAASTNSSSVAQSNRHFTITL